MSVAGLLITFTNSLGESFYTNTDANGAYTITVPAGPYTMTIGMESEPGYHKVFDVAVVTDVDQNSSLVYTNPVPDVDSSPLFPATVDVYYDKEVSAPNQPPVSTAGAIDNDRSVDWTSTVVLTPSMFLYDDDEGDALDAVKITGIPTYGKLKYAGVDVTINQILPVTTMAFAQALTYDSNQDVLTAHEDVFSYLVRTANNVNFG